MTEEEKAEVQAWSKRFWQWEPQPCFPEFVKEFAEQGIDIRKLPNRNKFAERHIVKCDKCGHPVGRVTPNMGKFGGGQFVSFAEEQKHKDWLEKCGLLELENIEFVIDKGESNA